MKNRFPHGRLVFFVTGNLHKYDEARLILAEFGLTTGMVRLNLTEPQDDDIENIAVECVLEAVRLSKLPLIVEDAGLFIDALNGFPGPYSKYVYQTIGNKGILKLLQHCEERSARFRSVVAYCSSSDSPLCFEGIIEGAISESPRGTSGFGFDPIFEPSEELGRTFGELTINRKNKFSHRARALRKFAEWYVSTS